MEVGNCAPGGERTALVPHARVGEYVGLCMSVCLSVCVDSTSHCAFQRQYANNGRFFNKDEIYQLAGGEMRRLLMLLSVASTNFGGGTVEHDLSRV